VAEDTEVVATVDLPRHRLQQNTTLKIRPSLLPLKTTRLARQNPVAHHLLSLRDPTQALTDMVPHRLHSQKVTTRTTDTVPTMDELAVAAAADVEVHGAAAATLDHLLVLLPSCKT